MKVVLTDAAREDVSSAYEWYESEFSGLGEDFVTRVDSTLESITNNPRAYQKIYRDIRRATLARFPYGVFYLLETDRLVVLAVTHHRRAPERWQDREP